MPPSDLMWENPAEPWAAGRGAAFSGGALSDAARTAALAKPKAARPARIVERGIRSLLLSYMLFPTVQPNRQFYAEISRVRASTMRRKGVGTFSRGAVSTPAP